MDINNNNTKNKQNLTWRNFTIIGTLIILLLGIFYYVNVYIPQNKLDKIIKDITEKIHSENDSIKSLYATYVLAKGHNWYYEDVNDSVISSNLTEYWESSFKIIESKAFAGNADYQFLLGQMYNWADKRYHYVNYNAEKAAYWWEEAAKQGYIKAYNNLGLSYLNGIGVEKNLKKAVGYLKKGAEAGDDFSQLSYGDLFIKGITIKVGSHKEIRTTRNGYNISDENIISRQFDYNTIDYITKYYVTVDDYETLVSKDIEKARFWWKKSAAQGNSIAKERLQKIY